MQNKNIINFKNFAIKLEKIRRIKLFKESVRNYIMFETKYLTVLEKELDAYDKTITQLNYFLLVTTYSQKM